MATLGKSVAGARRALNSNAARAFAQQVRHASGNRAVVYKGPGQVAVETNEYPKLELPEQKRK
jgi:hypothetical protein